MTPRRQNMKETTSCRMAKREIGNPTITPYIRELHTAHRQLRNGPIRVRMTGQSRGIFASCKRRTAAARDAAIRAGYSERGAHVRGAELLANRNISAAIKKAKQSGRSASSY